MSKPNTIVAKFECVTAKDDGSCETIVLEAVTADGGESNRSWSEATPWGRLEFGITNPAARGMFEPGKCYLLRFEAAPSEG